jgi:cobalt/nickel transport system permease protein
MHIPDGYLSPATCVIMYTASVPFWYSAVNRVRKVLTNRTVPVLALFAAFSFVLMMFNIPLPGGTTGHAVGGTLLSILLGPWAAILGVSVVLGIQALLFGDGGLLTFGANCFNMAIVLPLVGYFIYKIIAGNSETTSSRRVLAAVVGSYFGIVAASLAAGIELGIQPALFHAIDGTPLYAPYSLDVAVPAMLLAHLLIAGPVEAAVTGLVFAYMQRSHPSLIKADESGGKAGKIWILWGALALLALATPLGLLASGTAWGEWGVDELKDMGLGFIPQGLEKLAGWWPALFQDYGVPGTGDVIGYILSALVGLVLIAFLLWMLGRWLSQKNSSKSGSFSKGEPRS